LVEVEPGRWHLTAQTGVYGVVRLLIIGAELGYRVTTYAEPRELVGYYRALQSSAGTLPNPPD